MSDPFEVKDEYPVMARDGGFYRAFVAYRKVPGLSERQAYECAKRKHSIDKGRRTQTNTTADERRIGETG